MTVYYQSRPGAGVHAHVHGSVRLSDRATSAVTYTVPQLVDWLVGSPRTATILSKCVTCEWAKRKRQHMHIRKPT